MLILLLFYLKDFAVDRARSVISHLWRLCTDLESILEMLASLTIFILSCALLSSIVRHHWQMVVLHTAFDKK